MNPKIYFCGKPRQLKALLSYLVLTYGKDARISDLVQVICR